MIVLKANDTAPDFELLDQNNRKVTLKGFRGKKLLVYFYPKANTPGCTKQSCSVSEALPDFDKLQIAAVGISPDEPSSQKKFDEKFKLGFLLLSDEDKSVAKAYGAFGMKTFMGKKSEGIIRSSFLIDEKGNIIEAWYKVKPEDTVPLAMEALGK